MLPFYFWLGVVLFFCSKQTVAEAFLPRTPSSSFWKKAAKKGSLSSCRSTSAEGTMESTTSSKVETAKALFEKHFGENPESTKAIAVAPGRVNLIGEHTDYTGGFVLPFAIDYSTVVYGRGTVELGDTGERKATLRFVSGLTPETLESLECKESTQPPETKGWTTYVLGTVFQYLPDLPEGAHLVLEFTIEGDVPLGSGLSSSASLEVSVARFLEAILASHAFSSEEDPSFDPAKIRALRCQKAENEWCDSPCGIMDQAIISAAESGSLILIDCRSLAFESTTMASASSTDEPMPVLVVANSNVQHSIGGGEYPIRVAQCRTATEALQSMNPDIEELRDATLEDVEAAKDLLDDVSYRRAKHVVTENERTLDAKEALEMGEWEEVGALMNASHSSMRDDYEVSCDEVDVLVEIAQTYEGVYGSRLTGGGFGGCTVTLVDEDAAEGLMAHMKAEYKSRTGLDCPCFVTRPSRGAHLLSIENYKPLV